MFHIRTVLIFLIFLCSTSIVTGQSSHLDFLLMEAIQNADPKAVNDAIKEGANVHSSYVIPPERSMLPLELALNLYDREKQRVGSNYLRRREAIINILIQNGAADLEGQPWTILHRLASNHNIRDIIILLQKGAHINAKDTLGNTPLHEVVKLCSKCLQFPLTDDTKLFFADYKQTIEFLISQDADINTKNHDRNTPLHVAIENTVFLNQRPPFFYYIFTRHLPKIQKAGISEEDVQLTFFPINVYILDMMDRSFLNLYYISYIKFIQFLVESGADVHAKNNEALTPLDIIAQKKYAKYYKAVTNTLLKTKPKNETEIPIRHNIVHTSNLITASNDEVCKDSLNPP